MHEWQIEYWHKLIAAFETATEPDREIDRLVYACLDGDTKWLMFEDERGHEWDGHDKDPNRGPGQPRYFTADLEIARELVPAGWFVSVLFFGENFHAYAFKPEWGSENMLADQRSLKAMNRKSPSLALAEIAMLARFADHTLESYGFYPITRLYRDG